MRDETQCCTSKLISDSNLLGVIRWLIPDYLLPLGRGIKDDLTVAARAVLSKPFQDGLNGKCSLAEEFPRHRKRVTALVTGHACAIEPLEEIAKVSM